MARKSPIDESIRLTNYREMQKTLARRADDDDDDTARRARHADDGEDDQDAKRAKLRRLKMRLKQILGAIQRLEDDDDSDPQAEDDDDEGARASDGYDDDDLYSIGPNYEDWRDNSRNRSQPHNRPADVDRAPGSVARELAAGEVPVAGKRLVEKAMAMANRFSLNWDNLAHREQAFRLALGGGEGGRASRSRAERTLMDLYPDISRDWA
jgi:hypothetical protein